MAFPFWAFGIALSLFLLRGLFVVNPGEGKVLQLFGSYLGTAKSPGLRWDNPLLRRTRLSLRVRNFESQKLKVNDNEGNPIEIAAVVVWRVVDTAEASFEVDNYENYVHVQSESALQEPGDELHLRHARRCHDVAARPHGGGGGSPEDAKSRTA